MNPSSSQAHAHAHAHALVRGTQRDLGFAMLLHLLLAVAIAVVAGFGAWYVARAMLAMGASAMLIALTVHHHAPHARFGPANRVTLLRLSLVLLLAAAIGEPLGEQAMRGLAALATLAALLDAADGPLARASGLASRFGARFDMETDALLTLVLCALVLQQGQAGPWVLASGLMRYAFVAAAWLWPSLAQPLPPSRRRQAVCVLQIVGLIVCLLVGLLPGVSRSVPSAIAAACLAVLTASFVADIVWLVRPRRAVVWLLRFGAAFFVLNTLLTFENRLGTLGVAWSPRLSFELCAGVLGLVAWVAWRGALHRRAVWALAVLCTALAVVRYADVTVPEFFGRPVNLYWDAPHAWELIALARSALAPWQFALALFAGALALLAMLLGARWAIAAVADGLLWRPPRRWLAAAGAALCAAFVAYPFAGVDTRWFFSLPITPTLARQALLMSAALSTQRTEASLTRSPSFAGNLAGLQRADVLLLFAESYGVTTFDHPPQAAALAAPRARLMDALQRNGMQVVSARVRSPTFGGASWLAHAALLSGVDTHDPNDYDLLLTTQRPTLVKHFAAHGYRTVGWMPGLQRPWPEGAFYGFDRLADARGVGYAGPAFGYWRIPDQASIALLQAQELAAPQTGVGTARAPRFIVFPTLASHAPFRPLPPYESQWDRLLGREAYAPVEAARANEPLLDLVPAYLQAIDYTFAWLGDWLSQRAPANMLTIVIGDHQPLAAVSGSGASWDVPVHIISRNTAVLGRLRAAGFVDGMSPGAQTLVGMHELAGLLDHAFDLPRVDIAGRSVVRQ